jgi:hypothetical protein
MDSKWELGFMSWTTFKFFVLGMVLRCLVELVEDDEVFFYCQGENFLLIMWSIATFCMKVGWFVQNLTTMWLAHSFKHLTLISFTKNVTQPPQLLVCHNLALPIKFQCCLLPLLTNSLILSHIFTCLPMTLSKLWHFCWVNKSWFKVVRKSVAWNALELFKLIIDATSMP